MRYTTLMIGLCAVWVGLAGCGGQQSSSTGAGPVGAQSPSSAGPALTTKNMGPLNGQRATCEAPHSKTFDLEVLETAGVELGLETTFAAWTYNGRIPGPTLEVCQGDTVTIHVRNSGTTFHGLDTHAFKIDATHYGPTAPGTTLTIEKPVDTPGVFMYHCAAGPVTDLHIKSGLHGAMIVYPRAEQFRPAREIVVVQDAVFGTRNAEGLIPGTDPTMTLKNAPAFSMFNGRLDNDPVHVAAGDLVRMYFVNVGPGAASAHVIGSMLDRVLDGEKVTERVQTYLVPAGGGAILEFFVPETGVFPFVDHDKLAYLSFGMALPFTAP